MSKKKSLTWICFAYVLAIAAALASIIILRLNVPDLNLLLSTLIADIIATIVIFCFSFYFKNSSFYDAYWSVIPPLILWYWLFTSENEVPLPRALLVSGLILYWAIRLTYNWAKHWEGIHHEDWRYVELKEQHSKYALLIDLFGIHLFPTFQVFAGMLPIYAIFQFQNQAFSFLDLTAAFITFSAITIQLIADVQLHRFIESKFQSGEKGAVINNGIWAWSRHPNYFGELGFWFGLFLFGLAACPNEWYWQGVGICAMTLMFVFVSVPLMEKRSLQRRPNYQTTIDKVSMLFPFPPKR